MGDPIRALLAEMADALDHNRQCLMDDRRLTHPLAERARAALAAAQPAPPAEGEVAELVAWLHSLDGGLGRRATYSRIAELLTRAYPPAPVPEPVAVSERLPQPEDCDAEGRCWLGGSALANEIPTWILGFPAWAARWPNVHRLWLPASALPLPTTEEQP